MIERGTCTACLQRTVERDGLAANGRPLYRCRNGKCDHQYTMGDQGEPWDRTAPAGAR
jgi:hypothetical protein